jgi:hypothetical protein
MSSPSPKKKTAPLVVSKHASITGSLRSRVLNFVERRCRICGHLPHDHAGSVVVTFALNLDFKTRAAWASAFASFDDVASEAMKDCIARVYEPSVLRILDEHTAARDHSVDDSVHSFLEDDDLSAATESITGEQSDFLENKRFFRFTLWKAQNLPSRGDGRPHTWVVQAKFGKTVITSSEKTGNDPVWKEHFHFVRSSTLFVVCSPHAFLCNRNTRMAASCICGSSPLMTPRMMRGA